MKARIGVDDLFRQLGDDSPLRSEMFSVAQLERHAEALAEWHQVDPLHGPDRMLARLAQNETILLETYKLVTEAAGHQRRITPAGEWLLGKFYLIEEQIRTARRQLPRPYSRRLPRLLSGPSAGGPRVYDLAFPLNWIEQQLPEQGQTIEQMVQSEGQQQAVDQVSIGSSINSLRELDAIDWRTFVETQSIVEQTLLDDPAVVYGGMDFTTRDQYRHVIEAIAKRSLLTEHKVARQTIQLAQRNAELHGTDHRSAHVGYFLIDKGLPELERATRMRRSLSARVGQITRSTPLALCLGAIFLIAVAVTVGVPGLTGSNDGLSWTAAVLLWVGLVNWLATMLVRPHRLPRLDFSEGIPPEFRTLVAVPTMLFSSRNVGRLLDALEVRYLAIRDVNLRFCRLTDFRDAETRTHAWFAP